MILSSIKSELAEQALTGYAKNARERVSLAVRNGLAMMERHHKTKEIRRGAGKSATVADRWSWRTGALAKSYRIIMKKGDLVGYYGSNSKYSRMMEEGTANGPITPKSAKMLAIPLDAAKYGVGGTVSPRNHDGLFMIRSRKGNLLLVKGDKGGITPMFVLKKSVRIKGRPTIKRTETATVDAVQKLIADAAVGALEDGK